MKITINYKRMRKLLKGLNTYNRAKTNAIKKIGGVR